MFTLRAQNLELVAFESFDETESARILKNTYPSFR